MPATTAQAPPQQPQPQNDEHLIALIIAALAAATTVKALTASLRAPFRAAGISAAALSAIAALVSSWPHDTIEGIGPATRWAVRANLLRRASFFLNAARRTQRAIVAARSQGEPVMAAIQAALAQERRWFSAHVAASTQRLQATARVDSAASQYGNLLGWNAVLDPRCTPECRAANKKNFRADVPPAIGFPGTTHPKCRCYPSSPFPDAPVLP